MEFPRRKDPDPREGDTLDAWVLVEPLHVGPSTRVYSASALGAVQRQPTYAVKLLRASRSGDGRYMHAMQREAWLGQTVRNPHLVSVLVSHVQFHPCYFVMPLLNGERLDRLTARGLIPPLPVALWLVRQAAEALAALHDAGWMHCDIKSGNLLAAENGHTTLLDLGLARRVDEAEIGTASETRGTPAYMAPELFTTQHRGDIRSDIYSLGVVLFELLAGRLPFEGHTAAELAAQHVAREPADVRNYAAHIPLEVARLVRQMLAKQPLRRPQTPRELGAHLMRLETEALNERPWPETEFAAADTASLALR